jgi:hypothetical protein
LPDRIIIRDFRPFNRVLPSDRCWISDLDLAWLTGYLEIQRHMSVQFTGWAAAVPFVWGVVGGVLGGYGAISWCAAAWSR